MSKLRTLSSLIMKEAASFMVWRNSAINVIDALLDIPLTAVAFIILLEKIFYDLSVSNFSRYSKDEDL